MLNETINQTLFERVSSVTTTPEFIVLQMLAWAIPFFIYLIIAFSIHGRSPSGARLNKTMIHYPNALWAIILFFFELALIFVLIIFPLPLKVLG